MRRRGRTASGFRSWLVANRYEAEGGDGVKVTFHGAKGLEWPWIDVVGLEAVSSARPGDDDGGGGRGVPAVRRGGDAGADVLNLSWASTRRWSTPSRARDVPLSTSSSSPRSRELVDTACRWTAEHLAAMRRRCGATRRRRLDRQPGAFASARGTTPDPTPWPCRRRSAPVRGVRRASRAIDRRSSSTVSTVTPLVLRVRWRFSRRCHRRREAYPSRAPPWVEESSDDIVVVAGVVPHGPGPRPGSVSPHGEHRSRPTATGSVRVVEGDLRVRHRSSGARSSEPSCPGWRRTRRRRTDRRGLRGRRDQGRPTPPNGVTRTYGRL